MLFLMFQDRKTMGMSQVLSGAHKEAILSAISVKHQHSSVLVLLKLEDATPWILQPPKEVDRAAILDKEKINI